MSGSFDHSPCIWGGGGNSGNGMVIVEVRDGVATRLQSLPELPTRVLIPLGAAGTKATQGKGGEDA